MSTTIVHSDKPAPLPFELWTTSLLGESFSDDLIRQFDVRRSLLRSDTASKGTSDKQPQTTTTTTAPATINDQRVQAVDDCSVSDLESEDEEEDNNQSSVQNATITEVDSKVQPTRDQMPQEQTHQEGAPSSPPLSFLNSPPPSTLHLKGRRQTDERAHSKQLLRKSSEFFQKVIKIKSNPVSKEKDTADNTRAAATPVSSSLSQADSNAMETTAIPVIRQYPPKPLQYSSIVHPPSDDPKRFSLPATQVQPACDTGTRRKSAYFENGRTEQKRRSILRHFRFTK